MQNLLAFGLLTTSISAQTVLQQYVDCDIKTDGAPTIWTEKKFDDIKTKAACKTELDAALAALPALSDYTACAVYKQEGEVYTCAYYAAKTDKDPSDIRVAKTKEDGAMMFASFHIGKETPEDEMEGVPLAKSDAAGDSASSLGGAIMAVFAAVAMTQ